MKFLIRYAVLFVLPLLIIQTPSISSAEEFSQPVYDVIEELDVKVEMRDGIRLSTNIYRPDDSGRFPALLMRSPYGNGGAENSWMHFFTQKGYAVVVQDVRGKFESEGVFAPPTDERQDGYDTQQWVGRQPWCNGKIGTFGRSYIGVTQWASAPLQSPHLVCMMPVVATADNYDFFYPGGAFRLRLATSWGFAVTAPFDVDQEALQARIDEVNRSLPLLTQDRQAGWRASFLRDWISHPRKDTYWSRSSIDGDYASVKAAVFNIGGWFDLLLEGTLEGFTGMTGDDIDPGLRARQRLLVGPWNHGVGNRTKVGEFDFGETAKVDIRELQLRWFDSQLKGVDNGILGEPPVRIFTMGVNRWREEWEWPLARTQYTRYYLNSNGKANTLHGDGELHSSPPEDDAVDTFIYDPENPVPSHADTTSFNPFRVGPHDQTSIEERSDVLVYTSDLLDEDLEVTGPVEVILYATSSATNTDFTAKLVDVYPDGRAINLCDGIIRASYRNGVTETSNIEPGKVYEYRIDLLATSNVFRRGHRFRVELSSSNFPRFDRNLNTGLPAATDTTWVKAEQKIHHSREYPSCIVLPIIE